MRSVIDFNIMKNYLRLLAVFGDGSRAHCPLSTTPKGVVGGIRQWHVFVQREANCEE
jgi:hypothetical protein